MSEVTPCPIYCTDYDPDIQMQGDCRNCGNTYASHQPRTYTNDADCAGGLSDRARAALKGETP